ncbi:AlkA N-terminal domain-containing protein [Halomonas sp. M4R1S46]|uniref:AlkA N-terminal domain-containing protein n=1 Tax=Halomonas sp. M4R1S46 TaxID=2982692 RepID=UPI0021E4FB62|nr:AlkA N-terminal domain-containing protein [Halomonas sp. M4R1S46]UYG07146.1 helix-turn-helix domain-containing protein [Halomonas sp. M4R1S46]
MLDPAQCRQARLARDARFDGRFFVGVTTTGIYCRPVCPATPPRERNVRYFDSALAAAEAGFRPCLRCRPDSAPDSPAWRGTHTTLERALRLIDEGALQEGTLTALCDRLGIGERYLRRLFQQRIGVSPKAYAQHRQCLFAKQLLHQTTLPVTDIAYASGFHSLRRFNDAFRTRIGLAPRDLRRRTGEPAEGLTLQLAYRPPYAWEPLRDFHASRAIEGLEWVGERHYGRCIRWGEALGQYTAEHLPDRHAFRVRLELDDLHALAPVVRRIRRVLDLDADTVTIEAHLSHALPGLALTEGLRLPGVWSPFEAGVRAILGQQVAIGAARRLVTRLVAALGEPAGEDRCHFPTPATVAGSDLAFLAMPNTRRETLRRFASWYADGDASDDPAAWTTLKGIGPWTANYAALRGTGHPDIWLAGDAGVRRALPRLDGADPASASPWRSYLTLQLWSQELQPQAPRSQADD